MKKSLATPCLAFVALGLGLAAVNAPPVFADEQPELWSPAFLDVVDQWQSRYSDLSLPEYLSDERPDVMADWVVQASSALGGSILAAYEDAQPALVDLYEETYLEVDEDGNVVAEDASFVDFLIHGTDGLTFAELEARVVAGKGRDLATFAGAIEDGAVLAAYQELPADAPIHAVPLGDFVASYQDPALDAEAALFEASAPTAPFCTCRVLAAVSAPNQAFDSVFHLVHPNGSVREERSWWLVKRGAARRLFTDRFIRNGLNQLVTNTLHASATIRFTMACSRNIWGLPNQCSAGQGCSAQLKVGARYDSRVWVKNEATRAFPAQSIGSTVAVVDMMALVANPGPLRQVLAEKGLGLERIYHGNYNALAMVQGIRAAFDFTSPTWSALSGTAAFPALMTTLANENVNNVLGVGTYYNQLGEASHLIASKYSNLTLPPRILGAGTSQKIEMTSFAQSRSRGWGATTRGRSRVAADYYLVGAATGFSCTNATPPAGPKVAWSYNSVDGAPHAATALRAQVDAFILAATGLTLPTSATNGTN